MRSPVFDYARHSEALLSLVATSLASGDAATAFAASDRRCRIHKPGARDLLARGEASRLLGALEYAEADLRAAFEIDPTEVLVNRAILSWGPETDRAAAADRILSADNPDRDAVRAALEEKFRSGAPACGRLRLVDGEKIVGWAVWRGAEVIGLNVETDRGRHSEQLAPDPAHPLASLGFATDIEFDSRGSRISGAELEAGGVALSRLDWPVAIADIAPPSVNADRGDRHAPTETLVVIPVYKDLALTRLSIESALSQEASVKVTLVVVDDCSPDGDLRAYLDGLAETGAVTLIRTRQNLGFVGAVNEALKRLDGQDLLLLNADAILPRGAIERLRRAAYSAPDIGTVTPLSNNGEFTSFPQPFVVNPMPAREDIERLDSVAAAANAGKLVTLPNGVGFCLYVTSRGFEAVGGLSTVYERGYGEDIEFCLVARERGYRSVCATDVFVGHAGNRSFGQEKRSLVVRNLKVLERRFPTYRFECAAFVAADPLAPARRAIDRDLPMTRPARLIVQGSHRAGQAVAARARWLTRREPDRALLLLTLLAGGAVEIRAFDGLAPQSMRFDLRLEVERAALFDRLSQFDLDRIELVDPAEAADDLMEIIYAAPVPKDFLLSDLRNLQLSWSERIGACASPAGPEACSACANEQSVPTAPLAEFELRRARLKRALANSVAIRPSDAISAAFAARLFDSERIEFDFDRPKRNEAAAARGFYGPTLAVLAPTLSTSVERLLRTLARACANAQVENRIVVLGACIDDLALMAGRNIHVCGPVPPLEYERLLRQFEVGYLLCPYRTSHLWLFDELESTKGLRKAFFDWSFGAAGAEAADLALDPRTCDEKVALRLLDWWKPGDQTTYAFS